jgi:hypothetical protein
VEHWFVTGTWVWFHFVGFHAFVPWQLTQLAVVGTWVPSFPVAALPLWHPEQFVAAVYKLWSGLEPDQVLVDLWHVSHTV